jgi:two-component system LytT family response regulator
MTDPYRVLIVDDEAPARQNLRLALTAQPGWQVVGEAASAAEARALMASQALDVLLLDVQMPVETGVRFARTLARTPQPPIIVFVTAYDAFAIEAFEAHAMDYLLKPFDDARLAQTLHRAAALLALQQQAAFAQALGDLANEPLDPAVPPPTLNTVTVRSVRRIERIKIEDVLWISSAGNYVELHLPGRTVLHRAPLNWMEARLDASQFVRVHRTALVRRSAIREFRSQADAGGRVILNNGDEVAVSPKGASALKRWWGTAG